MVDGGDSVTVGAITPRLISLKPHSKDGFVVPFFMLCVQYRASIHSIKRGLDSGYWCRLLSCKFIGI